MGLLTPQEYRAIADIAACGTKDVNLAVQKASNTFD